MAKLKLTDEFIEKAAKYIAAGNYAVIVCQYMDIAETTYYSWIKQAEQDIKDGKETIFTKFLKSIKKAEAEAEMRNIETIRKEASMGTWQAAAWYLERKHRDRYGRQTIEITGKDGGAIEVESPRDKITSRIACIVERTTEKADT